MATDTALKLCKDCRYFGPFPLSRSLSACRHPLFDPIMGGRASARYCSTERSTGGSCRPEAVLFEPAPPRRPWWRFW